MNVVKIYAGLGNQMFQYAFGKSMEANGIKVCYDLSWFAKPADPPRPFALNKFRTDISVGGFMNKKTIHESDSEGYTFNPEYLTMEDVNFFGYWQHQGYVQNVLPLLREHFKVRPKLYTERYLELKEQIVCSESIALHVRRGDYLTKGHHLLPIEYYAKALDMLVEKKVEGKVYVFSDDVTWCKENFIGSHFVFVNEVDYLSFDLMRLCPHKIVANSTFSWWAAMVGDIYNGMTMAPLRWRLRDDQEEKIKEQGFIPEHWIRI